MNAPVKPGVFRVEPGPAPDQPAPIIRFAQIGKTYAARGGQGSVTALSGIDLDVPQGAIVGVIGRYNRRHHCRRCHRYHSHRRCRQRFCVIAAPAAAAARCRRHCCRRRNHHRHHRFSF